MLSSELLPFSCLSEFYGEVVLGAIYEALKPVSIEEIEKIKKDKEKAVNE